MNNNEKQEFLDEFKNGITVRELISRLQRLNPDMIVINKCRDHMPITSVKETSVDYCFDEIIKKEVVSIF